MWHHIPYGAGLNMIGAVENIMHAATPFGVATAAATRPQSHLQNQMCLCETCVYDSRHSAKQLKAAVTSTTTATPINNTTIGLGCGDIKTFFKQGWFRLKNIYILQNKSYKKKASSYNFVLLKYIKYIHIPLWLTSRQKFSFYFLLFILVL